MNVEIIPKLTEGTLKNFEETNSLTYSTWGAPLLTLDQYKIRESTLIAQAFPQKSFRLWVLLDDFNKILASCETYEREGWLFCGSSSEKTVTFKRVRVHSVASVFTPEKYRGKGYASRLMTLLYERLANMTNNWTPRLFETTTSPSELSDLPIVASTLYSDIGPKFYAKFGWSAAPAITTIIDISIFKTTVEFRKFSALSDSNSLKEIKENELQEIIEQDRQNLVCELQVEQKFEQEKSEVDLTTFVIPPHVDPIQWLWTQSRFYHPFVAPSVSFPEVMGRVHDSGSFVIWYHDWKEKVLVLLRFRLSNEIDVNWMLLCSSLKEAERCGFEKVKYWGHGKFWGPDNIDGICVSAREDSIPALALFENFGEVTWKLNEKFAWV